MSMWINVVTLLFAINYVSARSDDLYEIPIPEIVAFTTGGFRISIPEKFGITEFKFRGNVNEEIQSLRPGRINMETQHKSKGKWVLENTHTYLKRGDFIFYWIFVKRDRLGYVRQPNVYEVKELVPYFMSSTPHTPPSNNFPLFTTSPTTEEPWNYPTVEDGINTDGLMCLNNTESVIALANQVESLTKKLDILMSVIEKLPGVKKLTVSGRIPQDENPVATVRFILWEKLDLKPNIVSAVRNNDGSIMFEVETLEEKIEVLKLAQENLVNSRVIIS